MKRYSILSLLFIFFALGVVAQVDSLILPFNATTLTEEQKNSNPDYLAYPFMLASQMPEIKCNQIIDCMEPVDLGLSVLWATCNVGAEKPEDYGDYFAWGEVKTKAMYDFATYKYFKGTSTMTPDVTKYCDISLSGYNGFVDNKFVLDPEDDAATVNWGGEWRIPTDAELTELREKCTWIWTVQNGVNGYKVTGPNGNSIFLPAVGYINNERFVDLGKGARYWSSSLELNGGSVAAYSVSFSSNSVVQSIILRTCGQPVRPVCPKNCGGGTQLPNSSFENWEHDELNDFEDGQRPVCWNTSNIKKTIAGITAGANMVFPDGNAHSGTYCVKAINMEVGAAGITEMSPAWVTLGRPWCYIDGLNTRSATAGTDGGIEFTYRPDTIAVWIKRTASGNENAHIVFYSWKGTSRGDSYKNKNNGCSSTTHYDEESDIRLQINGNDCETSVQATQIAEAMWRSKETFTEWTEIKVPIQYFTNEKPEKCNVIISAANYPNKRANEVELNATIWADDIRLIYSSGIDNLYVDGRMMLSCESGQFDYTCYISKSVTSVGEITLKRSGRYLDASEFTINKGAIGEVTTITVKAEDGSSVSTYNIIFAYPL